MKNKKEYIGFTLIELMSIISIIAILAAIAVPNFLEAQTRAKISRVRSDMAFISVGLETYRLDMGHYPFNTEPVKEYDIAQEIEAKRRILINPFDITTTGSLSLPFQVDPRMLMSEDTMGHESEDPQKQKSIDSIVLIETLVKNNIRYSPLCSSAFIALTTPIPYCSSNIFADVFHRDYSDLGSICYTYKYLNLNQINPDGVDLETLGKNLPYLIYSIGPATIYHPFPFPPIDPIVKYDATNGTISYGTLYNWDR